MLYDHHFVLRTAPQLTVNQSTIFALYIGFPAFLAHGVSILWSMEDMFQCQINVF